MVHLGSGSRRTVVALVLAIVGSLLVGAPLATAPAAAAGVGQIRITEWMYDGAGGEWVELTNVGTGPVDLDGWTYDDDSANPAIGFDLSPLSVVQPGESVVFAEEDDPSVFRSAWGLDEDVDVLGGYTNNLGRADQINIFDGADALVDRLTYGDNTAAGGPRTSGASAWVSAAGLGANIATEWTLSTVGDAEGSVAGTGGAIGSPGRSTHAPDGEIRITEWMYDGAGGEWVELTNVGGAPVDLDGWTYDDDSANPAIGFDLSPLGVVAPGESVVFAEEDDPAVFRTTWGLCAGVDVLGGYTNNLGRADQINIFDGSDALVDRLTYGDNTAAGGPRTQGASAWVSAAGLGANIATEWTLSTVGDAEGSTASTAGPVGSPGRSTRAIVERDPCPSDPDPGGGIELDRPIVVGSIGDPTNPTATLTLTPSDGVAAEDVTVTVDSATETVLPDAGVTITGTGAERTVAFAPIGRGTSTVTFTAEEPGGATSETSIAYAASNQAPDPAGRYLHGVSDASSALDVGDGHLLIANDETNTIFLFDTTVGTSAPVKTWSFTAGQMGTTSEVDIEGVARTGDTLVWIGSHGNNREGEVREERRTMFATTITGSGASTEIAFVGRYSSLWEQLIAWDETDGHGLGADALGFAAAAAPGVLPNAPDGFNLEGFEIAPDGTTGYLGFRGPTVDEAGEELALIVPVADVAALNVGTPGTAPATFGDPILLDLGGRSIREIRRNAAGDYLISAGPSPSEPSWALYAWDGVPAHDAAFVVDLPTEDLLTGGTWESIATVPHPITAGSAAVLVTDSGDTDLYGTGQTKDLAPLYQKSYIQPVVLAAPASEPPVAAAGPDRLVDLGDVVTLDGGGSYDPEGAALGFAWAQTAGPAVTLADATTPTPSFTAPDGPATLTFRLTVTDGAGQTATDTVDVVVNGRPIALAGPDQLIDPGESVSLDGTGSTDPEGAAVTYQWDQTYGPIVTLAGRRTATATFTAPDGAGELRFRLIVRDPRGRSSTDFVHVVIDGPAPTADAGTHQAVDPSTLVTLSGAASTPTGLRYQWDQTSGPAVTLSGARTATATFTAPAVTSVLRFRLIVRDQRGRSATDVVTVEVDSGPPTADAGPDQVVVAGETVTLDGAGSSSGVTYQWKQTYGPAVSLAGAGTAHPTFVAPTGPAEVRFRLIVRDGRKRFAADFVHVTITAPT